MEGVTGNLSHILHIKVNNERRPPQARLSTYITLEGKRKRVTVVEERKERWARAS